LPQSSAATPAPKNEWVDVPENQSGGGDDGWVDVPTESKSKPEKQGFKKSLRAGMGFKPEGGFTDDVSQIGSGFRQMATHPIDSLVDLVKGTYGAQQDTYEKGARRMNDPKLSLSERMGGAVQTAEGVIPFVGPVLSRAGEQAGEGDYAGMAGTMAPLATGRPLEEGVRMGRSTLASAVEAAPEAGGAVAGYTAVPGHPYVGAYVGRELGRRFQGPATRLADMIRPDTRSSEFRTRIGGEWVPEGAESRLVNEMDADPVTRIPVPRREFPGENPNNMASVPRAELEGLAKTGKPGAGTQIQQLGGKVLYTPEPRGNVRESTTFSSKGTPTREPDTTVPVSPRARSSETKATQWSLKEVQESGGPNEFDYRMVKGNKRTSGVVRLSIEGDTAYAHYIGSETDPEFSPGYKGLRDVMDELKERHPGVKNIEWHRTSGAREENPGTVTTPLRTRPRLSEQMGGETKAPAPGARRPSEKVQALSEKPRDLGPEWTEGQRQHEISRNKEILRNKKATAEDRKVARARLSEAMEK
jgi:hypothetical protein